MTAAKLNLNGQDYELPIVEGTENETGLDISSLRGTSGAITLDPGFGNTGACQSSVTFINGEEGILRYRGYPIEQLAGNATFVEVCFLLIFGHLPSTEELADFSEQLTYHSMIHEDMKKFFEGYPKGAHPMAIMASMVASLSTYYPDSHDDLDLNIVRVLAKSKTLAAFAYKKSVGQPFIYPRNDLSWPGNFLRMMFAVPSEEYVVPEVIERALGYAR